ncbi:gliding motility-associated peptidyl-prolyl isomerase GldI [Galbibacter sp.]|uniref:gliding motility-associated peptidyl-prolyl isomerase GldI n=1 Tax=Galbibacter sp. TaxID=2918471 RepID=UPI002B8F5853|nr:gliding motility-associated peptidyl-prolyl isomerase GldI [Galbibacter sp.]HLV62022.1 gliding motility-associated peptidyl-prolyl isomerase GldI [Galbibacter sp.]
MKKLHLSYLYLLLFVFLAAGCSQPKPRKPISVKTGSFMSTSIERNKALLTHEEAIIDSIIAKDTLNHYHSSPNGYSYYFNKLDSTNNYHPKEGDVVKINYDIRTLSNQTIYSSEEIGEVTFKVDKEDYFPGLRTAVKLLSEGETATFLFPSSLAYGYHGDDHRIGTNQTIKSTIHIIEIVQKSTDSLTAN